MANASSVISDLCNDNFDLANFPSLPFPVENDDLNLVARMGSLFDASLKEGSVHNAQAFSQAPQCAQNSAQTFAQSQHVQSQPATMSFTSTQAFGNFSEPMLSQQNQPQPLLAEQPAMPSFLKGYVQTGMTMQQMQTPFALNSNTSFDSESSQQKVVKTEQPDSYLSDDQSNPDDTCAATPRRSSRKCNTTAVSRNAEQQEWLQQKKVGRPITYNGDPNAPELTEAERSRVKRRIANRESARRVKQRRKEMIDELQHKLLYVQHHHHHLMQHLSKMELEKGQLIGQLTDMKARCMTSQQDNAALKAQVDILEQKFGQQQQGGQQNQLQMGQQWPDLGTQEGPSTPQQALRIDVLEQEPHMGFK